MMQFPRTMKFQREADPKWSDEMLTFPGSERLSSCIQCGTCSGACPVSIYMDHTPRKVINLIREGFRDEALSCRTIWLCASCYACAALCPQKIKITDVMYHLKREALKHNMYPRRFPIAVLARQFYEIVKRNGRNSEGPLVLLMALKSNPLILLNMVRSGWHLFWAGRIAFKSEKIEGVAELQRALAAAKETHDRR